MPLRKRRDADPRPLFIEYCIPPAFPTVAPQPAPQLPTRGRFTLAFAAAANPIARSGRIEPFPISRSNSTAAGTMGILHRPTVAPAPRCSRNSMTPAAASSPNALPPVKRIPSIASIEAVGASNASSRVPGDPPRTSTPQTARAGNRSTVQPVAATGSSADPTSTPGTSTIDPDNSFRGVGGSASK